MVKHCVNANQLSMWLTFLQMLGLVPNGILAVWPASIALKKFAFLTVNVHLVTAVL